MVSFIGPASRKRLREPIMLTLILLLAAGMRLWRLDQNGYSNLHYAATVRSMLMSCHNFFFVAFDPAGSFSVDKPPVAFWIQAATARLLGFNGFSLIAPQALEGVIAVWLVYHLVRRRFAMEAALLASLVLAITPTSVAVDRSNSPDSCLVLVLVLAGWAAILSAERSDWRFLLLSAALVGVAFNVKMLVAYGVLPVFALVYLLGARLRPGVQLKHLAAALVVTLAVSASWGWVVDSTPPARRPYVGSSHNNSVLGLVLGHNGLERLFGPASGPPRSPRTRQYDTRPGFGGAPGPFRLAGRELAEQISWLFPIAAAGAVAIALGSRMRRPLEAEPLYLLIWGSWLGIYATAFSFARGIIHPYYTVLMAPPLAALVGIGVAALWRLARRGGLRLVALPTALILTALWQAGMLAAHSGWPARLLPLLVGGVCASVTGLVGACLLESRWAAAVVAQRAALGVGLLAVLLAPLGWSLTPVLAEGNPIIPIADPALLTDVEGLVPEEVDPADIRPLVAFLQAHRREERYLLATSHFMAAALIIVETGQPVMPTSGFMGYEPVVTHDGFADMVANRQVRFALLLPFSSPGSRRAGDWAPGGARIIDPVLWHPRSLKSKDPIPAVVHPGKAGDPGKGAYGSPGRPNTIRAYLKEMELYDFRPDFAHKPTDLQPRR
jgi:4-amino-4-deoxy-L-arabinose transferase-like glycosyltransferase